MHHYTQGQPPRQAHKGIPDGHYEEEQGQGGFFGPVSHLIKPKPSTRWTKIEGPLKPRLFDTVKIASGHQRLFYNNDVTVSIEWVTPIMGLEKIARRNSDGDEIYFCHKGSGHFVTEYGLLSFTPGSYVVIQKCMTHTVLVDSPTCFLRIENRNSHYTEPDRGIVGKHAIYDPNALGKPDLAAQQSLVTDRNLDVREVVVKHGDELTHMHYDEMIYDTISWKGDLFPFTLHMEHIMPLMSHRSHLPPSAHTTFVARGFVVCSFVPRPLEEDSDALKVPFYHQNMDYDEILFYHAGDFFSRDNLHAGMLSFHPAGFPHGPHPKAMEKAKTKTHTDEYAVMIDTRWPLLRDPAADNIEVPDYWKSWQKK